MSYLKYRGDADADVDALNPDAADDATAYRLKLSKWYQGTFNAIQHPIFWYLMNICRCLRSPMRHFFAFVQQQAKNNNEGEVLRQLVTGKLDELHDEYRELHNSLNQIISRAVELSGCDKLFENDPAGLEALSLVARKICFQQWASFQRRIYYPMQQWLCCTDWQVFTRFRPHTHRETLFMSHVSWSM